MTRVVPTPGDSVGSLLTSHVPSRASFPLDDTDQAR